MKALAVVLAALISLPALADERESDRRTEREKRHHQQRFHERGSYPQGVTKVGEPNPYEPKVGASNPYATQGGTPNPYATRGGEPPRSPGGTYSGSGSRSR
jgi:hypothetical protein